MMPPWLRQERPIRLESASPCCASRELRRLIACVDELEPCRAKSALRLGMGGDVGGETGGVLLLLLLFGLGHVEAVVVEVRARSVGAVDRAPGCTPPYES